MKKTNQNLFSNCKVGDRVESSEYGEGTIKSIYSFMVRFDKPDKNGSRHKVYIETGHLKLENSMELEQRATLKPIRGKRVNKVFKIN